MKIAKTLLITASILSILSCNNQKYKVQENAEHYIKAMAEYDFDAARQYATEETQHATLDFIESNIMPTVDTNYIKQNTPAKITIDSVCFASDTTATVYFRKTTPIQTNTPASVEMRLRNGKWLAHQIVDFTVRFGTQSKE